ncbi:SulP family inorganic anion transporter [Microbacterium elymi]|uniref:SulP family inorganic anion transporter n=1 Tax=Microbacterium elymi TaxID=2909587 RepID=A0ABY5NMB1_9MICO|nr:SulP family inorganic anion transporter [Microbacterium elymi]UUT36280.1 SulP family inorganic anion transporter [Microbacterium elymi]
MSAAIVGAITILAIVLFLPTRIGSTGLVIAVIVGSVAAVLLNLWVPHPVQMLHDMVDVPRGLPAPVLPSLDDILFLAVPALSLAFVGLVQGAGVSAGIPTVDGRPADASRDFIGQGVGNIVAGAFRGMPVGGSMSASSLVVAAGARTRMALFAAGATMALVILLLSGLVAYVAMPALAGLLIVVGVTSIKPSRVYSVIKAGPLQTSIMAVTFVLTLVIPLQFAVLVGVGLGIVLFVAQAVEPGACAGRADRRGRPDARDRPAGRDPQRAGRDPPAVRQSVLRQRSHGREALPTVSGDSSHAVVIVRLRGTDQLGLALIAVLRRYAHELAAVEAQAEGGGQRTAGARPDAGRRTDRGHRRRQRLPGRRVGGGGAATCIRGCPRPARPLSAQNR